MTDALTRVSVPTLDEKLGHKWKVLDDGFVRPIDYLGSDASIVQAARVSYGAGTKSVHEDAGLVRYLMRHGHTTPFEMCEIKLHVRAPMDTWRQWIRHRTASVNEYSTRYSVAIDSQATTRPTDWRAQIRSSRQGSSGTLSLQTGAHLTAREKLLHNLAREIYEERLGADVAREQARKDLPLSTYTEAYWKIDLHNLFHFLALRMDSHAQLEIRAYAEIVGREIVARWCPIAWRAFCDYRLDALQLTSLEVRLISALTAGNSKEAETLALGFGWLQHQDEKLRPNRERTEAEQKIRRLGLVPPW
jgi:thymidylate synthase (FAD)